MARLTTTRRKSLDKGSFALPDERAYPLDTKNRARNALSRGSENATPAQQATINRAVRKKYPSIEVDGTKRRVDTESHSYDFKQRNNLRRGNK